MTENLKDCYRDSEKKALLLISTAVNLIYRRLISWVICCLFARGICPGKSKIEAITKARWPETVPEMRSFLGLVNFCARCISDLAILSEPLRILIRHNVKFFWGQKQKESFRKLKEKLTNEETLGYFDTVANLQFVTDASFVGLEAVMLQVQNAENESPMQAVVLQMWRTQFANRKRKERKRKLLA